MKTRGYQFCCPGTDCHGGWGCEVPPPIILRLTDADMAEMSAQLEKPQPITYVYAPRRPRASALVPAEIWRPLSFRAKLRDWADWKPLCAFVEGLS